LLRAIKASLVFSVSTISGDEKPNEIILHPARGRSPKLSWEETAQTMAVAKEDWSEWDCASADGLSEL
jgi:hypothetical protein